MKSYAHISEDGQYRYALGRRWADGPVARFIMLNPSTADASLDDPTIRRCIGFARSWGLNGIQVLNLYAYRATNPKELWKVSDPVGPENDAYLAIYTEGLTVAAWGANAKPFRVAKVMKLLADREIYALGVTKAGQPKHPLYIAGDTQPSLFKRADPRGGTP